MDLAVSIDGGVAEIIKGNDVAKGELATFEPQEFTVTRPPVIYPRKNEPDYVVPERSFTVSILAPYSPEKASPTARKDHTAAFPPTGKNGEALGALSRVIASHGEDGAIPLANWKEELTRLEIIKPGDANDRATFKRIQKALSQHLVFDDDLVRIKIPPCPRRSP
jgi:hypothetical protein